MAATLFNASKSVIVHSLVPLDASTLDTLKEEAFLLVHSAPVAGENDYMEHTDVTGALVFAAWYNFKARWSVRADALALAGLANYHPGAALTTQSLEFLNASRNVFQMGLPSAGFGGRRLVYENPRQDPVAGDLVEVNFDVVSMFGESTGPGAIAPAAPELESSLTPAFDSGDWGALYGFGIIWFRMLTLTSPSGSGLTLVTDAVYWETRSIYDTAIPATIEEFLEDVDPRPDIAGQEIVEVFTCGEPGGTYLRESFVDEIISRLEAGEPDPFPPYPSNFFYEAHQDSLPLPADAWITGGTYAPGVTSAEQFVAEGYLEPGFSLTALFSTDLMEWLPVPPLPEP